MKKIIISLILWLPMSLFGAKSVSVSFNEYVDLMSVVWRLAGASEYNAPLSNPYFDSVDRHFADYKAHSVVQLARDYYQNGVGYDAVASFGALLAMADDGRIVLSPEMINDLDERWGNGRQEEFLPALNAFYADTHFHEWFVANKALRNDILMAFHNVSRQIDLDWLDEFFYKNDKAKFQIIVCPLACVNNYGVSHYSTDGTRVLSPVISCMSYEKGKISFDTSSVLPIIVHEFCHPYCNPLIDKYWESIAPMAEQVFVQDSKLLMEQAYANAETMMYETFVRASVIRYLQEHYTAAEINVPRLIRTEESRGFILTQNMVEALADYQTKRTENADIEAFMPSLAKAINAFDLSQFHAQKIEEDKSRVQYECNIANGAEDVPAGDFVVSITFDRPMCPSISLGMTTAEFPKYKGHKWSDDHRTLNVTFNMEPNCTYGFQIMGSNFVAEDGNMAVERSVIFKTRAE